MKSLKKWQVAAISGVAAAVIITIIALSVCLSIALNRVPGPGRYSMNSQTQRLAMLWGDTK